jgi:hypothetical protein
MVRDEQARRLRRYMAKDGVLWKAAAKAGMSEKTARKYLRAGKLPSEMETPRRWRTREDPFEEVWEEIREQLETIPGVEAKALFEDLQRRYAGRFQDGQLRTLQRHVKAWRALEGPPKEVFFPQVHEPGRLCQSDFTHMSSLGITIARQRFRHLIYHFVLTYSNWETGTICFSENFESLGGGLQEALWELGGVPEAHQTDQMTSAVHGLGERAAKEFTARYEAVLSHYGMKGRMIQAGKANENGDVEQGHHRFKRAVEQALLLRGSRDFASRDDYAAFLKTLFARLNAGRRERFEEERKTLKPLPARRLDACRTVDARVSRASTIHVKNNTYSVHSRLIGEKVQVRLFADHLEVWYAQRCVERLPRLRGESKHRIEYRHVIDWLVRKPGAFENYRYQADLFPTSRFRMAYDALRQQSFGRASKEYLEILYLAAREGETLVDDALRMLLDASPEEEPVLPLCAETVKDLVESGRELPSATEVAIEAVDLARYDALLSISSGAMTNLMARQEVPA